MACNLTMPCKSVTYMLWSHSVCQTMRGFEGRRGGASVVWKGRARQCRPLVASLNKQALHLRLRSQQSSKGLPSSNFNFSHCEWRKELEEVHAGEQVGSRFIIYIWQGKVMNCGGGGSCGTCIVEILEGQELLSEITDAEYKYLKKKPESWRLACQTIVGEKSNNGKVVVQRLPQKKK